MEAPETNFVTVVSVGEPTAESTSPSEEIENKQPLGYVTVLTIGDSADSTTEDVLVYRLPGERLGFGLKFEGGTKANEFVRRLFIQSCAPDSPASRVQSSWGPLTEGDEVLEIDSIAVSTMTRIDCVRCLKDSNVVIKLLVKHFAPPKIDASDCKQIETATRTRSVEDLPQVISAEKKRTPPPPPPVPPRKIPKRHHCVKNPDPAPPPAPPKKFQSPRSSGGRSSSSPDIPRRSRRFSDGSLGPPDAEVYVDLFSQESTQSLSESDDTGSSISTVVDRFGSFPTTTTSSLAGSLPSTPTLVQKHLDFSNLLNYDDEELSIALRPKSVYNQKNYQDLAKGDNEGIPLRPPSCFQDAPLSYGNEDMRIETTKADVEYVEKNNGAEDKIYKKPPVPPRSRDLINKLANGFKELHDENMNISTTNLPRLVDFVPKSSSTNFADNPIEIINVFLENERKRDNIDHNLKNSYFGFDEGDDGTLDTYSNELDLYSSKWSLSSQLATIGEVEEEGSQDCNNSSNNNRSTPIVIVENADCDSVDSPMTRNDNLDGKMETLSSDSRQPPDGHEFPDFVESSNSEPPELMPNHHKFTSAMVTNYHNHDHNDQHNHHQYVLDERLVPDGGTSVNSSHYAFRNVVNNIDFLPPLNKVNSVSNSDLSSKECFIDSGDDDEVTVRRTGLQQSSLHTRSQSLIDMSSITKQKGDRWSQLAEQRRKGLSKLKGLVIPEHVSENEATSPVNVNIPEIISHTAFLVMETKQHVNQITSLNNAIEPEPVVLPLSSPPWTSNTIPKYSPAFKRKSLQVYPPPPPQNPAPPKVPSYNNNLSKTTKLNNNNNNNEFRLELSDAPKSLESITSPTRSDCSFDYVSSFSSTNSTGADKKIANYTIKPESVIKSKESPIGHNSKLHHQHVGKSEDESDNDSAVSSSQSSYISRCSPPPSPTTLYDSKMRQPEDLADKYNANRLLKPASVEAINRKNILASAKCRSGRDLKVGSPVIKRKVDEEEESPQLPSAPPPPSPQVKEVNVPVIDTETITVEVTTTSPPLRNGVVPKTPTLKNEYSVSRPVPKRSVSSEKNTFVVLKPVTPKESKLPVKTSRSLLSSKNNNKSLSVNDLRKSFEQIGSSAPLPLPAKVPTSPSATKTASLKTASMAKPMPLIAEKKGRRTEEAAQVETVKLRKPVENVLVRKDESTGNNRRKIVLHPEFSGGSIGITLAGGNDYEIKEITVHKIRYGSVAYKDGSLKKGDRIISINGKDMQGLTHAESVEMLKEALTEFVLVVEEGKEETVTSPKRKSFIYDNSPNKNSETIPERTANHVIPIVKDGAGLGFSIEGGKESLEGDLPLRIKKIFQGGAAEKSGQLNIGDELLAINEISLINLSRIEAWSLMKKLADGIVNIHIHR